MTYMTENDGLTNRNHTVDILNGPVFLVLAVAPDIVLFNVVKRFLLAQQLDGDRIFYDVLSKFHDFALVRGRKQHHLA